MAHDDQLYERSIAARTNNTGVTRREAPLGVHDLIGGAQVPGSSRTLTGMAVANTQLV